MEVSGLVELHDQGRMTWTERERGWVAVPDEVVNAFARRGFEASASWVARATQRPALMFIEIDGELVEVAYGAPEPSDNASYRDEGGES